MIGETISAASAPPSAEAMPVPTAPQPSKSQPPQKAKMERDPRPAAYTPFAGDDPAKMENTAEAKMENSSSASPAAYTPFAGNVPAKMENTTEAKMENSSSARPAAYTPLAGDDPAPKQTKKAPPPYSPLAMPVKAEAASSRPPVTQATKLQKRKAAQNTAWGKQAKARIDAMKTEKKELQEEWHLIDSAWPSDWVAVPVPLDPAPSTPDGAQNLMEAIAVMEAATAAALRQAEEAAAAQRQAEEAAAQREAEQETIERAANAAAEAAMAEKETIAHEDLLGLFVSEDEKEETDEETAMHMAEHRAELEGIRLPT